MNSIFFDLSINVTNPTREETLLLYGLGEELLLTKTFVKNFSRLSGNKIRIEVVGCKEASDAKIRMLEALRTSKNLFAHTCSFQMI